MTKTHPIEGHGPPPKDLAAAVGTRYYDIDSGERWRMTGNGWSNQTFLHLKATLKQKYAWAQSAARAGHRLEDWAFNILDREAGGK
jgi:hypothetical protein